MNRADLFAAQLKTLWRALGAQSSRELVLFSLVLALAEALLRILVFSQGFIQALIRSVGFALGANLFALTFAALAGGIGWLVRGRFDARPLFTASLFATLTLNLCLQFGRPLTLLPAVGLPLGWVMLAAIFCASALSSVTFLMTILPQRWTRGIVGLTLVCATAGARSTWRENFAGGREGYMKTVFAEDEPTLARFAAEKGASSHLLRQDFQKLDEAFRREPGATGR